MHMHPCTCGWCVAQVDRRRWRQLGVHAALGEPEAGYAAVRFDDGQEMERRTFHYNDYSGTGDRFAGTMAEAEMFVSDRRRGD